VTASRIDQVPFVDLGRQHEGLRPAIDAALGSVLDDGSFILGGQVEAFEQEWAAYCEAEHAVGVASGTAAIQLTLEALDVGPDDEVIVPANTFVATVMPVLQRGAKPVLVDCDATTAAIDTEAVAAALTERTRAIIAVHLFGRPAEMDSLLELANGRGVDVIEDACQAHGARYRGRRVGALGRAGCFSFYPSKNLGAVGDGGAVVTNDGELADRVRLLRDLGQARKYDHVVVGHNERLDTIQAAVLLVKLPYLDSWNEARRGLAEEYATRLGDLPLGILPLETDREHVWHLYVVRSAKRDVLRETLATAGIATGLHYPLPVHLQPAFRSLGLGNGHFPVAERWSEECLSLPMFPELRESEIDAVAGALAHALGRNGIV
jgi:dTDP-4-amino-4,6-dideoxygalactose transaminase